MPPINFTWAGAPIAEWQEMLPWIRGWGAAVEALAPEGLRKALIREAKLLAGLYGVGTVMENLEDQYYAHTKDNADESEWQLLKEHLKGTGDLAFELGADAGISELARTAALLHDLGKYSKEFQARLRGSNKRVDHATAGAREIMALFPEKPQKDFADLLSYCIAGHHSGLPDYGSMADVETDGTLLARREKKPIKNYHAYKQEIETNSLEIMPQQPIRSSIFRMGDKESRYQWFSVSFFTRMLFSVLTDADWLDTERFVQGDMGRGKHASIEELTDQFNRFLARFKNPTSEINKKRTETLQACIEKSEQEPGFFTLTVPTGGGKTFASMAFALNHAKKKGLKRVIYVIPFTSIIEQNADEFRKALGDLGKESILEHHSNFDWEGQKKKETEEEANDETSKVSEKLKLAAENWDVPIVVTTNVQFFESLFSNKKRSARKLHSIAKSVIIFDEAQMLPREYLKPSLLVVQELVNNYGATAIFCTATQPSLEQFFPEKTQFTELAPDPQALFDFYRRVDVKKLGTQEDEELIEKLNAHEQALCIVNTRRHAKGLYEKLDRKDGSFHLSTVMCPAHRKEILAEIRQRLKDERPCRVISTQVMEAGIDVDFPVGYRAFAGLDSIIQAAGRVNREGKQSRGNVFVFNPKTEFIKRTPIFIQQTSAVAESALRDFGDDPTSIAAIEAYYKTLYNLQSEDSFDFKKIVDCFEKGKPTEFKFKTAAENFKFIENNTVSVIIPFDDDAKTLIEKLKYVEYPAKTVRQLQPYTVNIYEGEFMNLQDKGVIHTIGERYHVLDAGRMKEYYHPKTGLTLPERGSGEAIFFD
ncbi:MAG: CRISPR-associated helicase Cas3' [Anaerolineae bacterium]|nr:CRISPR-associated helicase Cas3' [Anaerolineae bacterium]